MVARAKVEAYGRREIEVQKIAISSEMDKEGQVFYKIEGQAGENKSMIACIYNKDEAITKYMELIKSVLEQQEKEYERMSE